jgi:hypothetical protein
MNADDRALWTKALDKIDAGTPELLTADEREVVEYFGGPDWLEPRPLARAVAVKPRRFEPGPLLTKALDSEGAHFQTEADFLAWFARLMKARNQ